MKPRSHMIKRGKIGSFLERCKSSTMHQRHAQIVDPLVANQIVRVPNGIKDLAYGNRRRGVLTNDFEPLLQLCRRRVFHPEKMKGFQFLAKTASLYWSEPVMAIVQKMQPIAKCLADPRKQRG